MPLNDTDGRTLLGRYRILLEIAAIFLAGFTITRLALLVGFATTTEISVQSLASVFWTGLKYDVLVACVLIQPQLAHFTWARQRWLATKTSRCIMEACWLIAFAAVPLMMTVETLFFAEFDVRLNYVAFEYLVYPTEVCGNIWQSYAVIPLTCVACIVSVSLYLAFRRRFQRYLSGDISFPRRAAYWGSSWVMLAGIWLTLDMSSMQVTNNRVANECAGNGWYTFVANAWNCHFSYDDFYPTIPVAEAEQFVRDRLFDASATEQSPSQNPLDRVVHGASSQADWNVVVVVEESLGADFVGVLGDDRGLTPHLDKLSEQGVLFDNFYATGNRTARALEAITTTLPPIPTESILKRNHSQHVYTLAHVLKARGYQTKFMYAGRGLFDGVRSFMTANGFDSFVEQKDFVNPSFENAWGVADEDLFHRVLTELDEQHQAGSPFFTMMLTVSNHRPFTYPDGRITQPSSEKKRENAVQYADWALGQFFTAAKQHAWYDRTLFVVLGDHGARVFGSQMFPMKSYRVPVLMIAPNDSRTGQRCSTIASTIDVTPTIMGLLGGDYRSIFWGRDVLNLDPSQGYALMQHNHEVAMLTAQHELIVLNDRQKSATYRLNPKSSELSLPSAGDPQHVKSVISFFQTANRLYYAERLFPSEISRSDVITAHR